MGCETKPVTWPPKLERFHIISETWCCVARIQISLQLEQLWNTEPAASVFFWMCASPSLSLCLPPFLKSLFLFCHLESPSLPVSAATRALCVSVFVLHRPTCSPVVVFLALQFQQFSLPSMHTLTHKHTLQSELCTHIHTEYKHTHTLTLANESLSSNPCGLCTPCNHGSETYQEFLQRAAGPCPFVSTVPPCSLCSTTAQPPPHPVPPVSTLPCWNHTKGLTQFGLLKGQGRVTWVGSAGVPLFQFFILTVGFLRAFRLFLSRLTKIIASCCSFGVCFMDFGVQKKEIWAYDLHHFSHFFINSGNHHCILTPRFSKGHQRATSYVPKSNFKSIFNLLLASFKHFLGKFAI